jgi:hypothetical protein
MGVMPRMGNCLFCEQDLQANRLLPIKLVMSEGAFVCGDCDVVQYNERGFYEGLLDAKMCRYSDYGKIRAPEEAMLKNLLNYFSFQFQLSEKDFKTSGTLFS